MNPTLSTQDLLEVEPYGDAPVRAGDVVLFRVDDQGPLTVHRVVAIDQDGIITRGDHNDLVDPWRLGREQILGRVIAARRGARRRLLVGGAAGQSLGVALRALNGVDRATRRWLHPLYRGLAGRGLLARLLPSRLAPRVAWYRTHGRARAQLLLGRHVIGRLDGAQARWVIRRPFRLLIDPALLPTDPEPPQPRP